MTKPPCRLLAFDEAGIPFDENLILIADPE
jgi:hypothetical protein